MGGKVTGGGKKCKKFGVPPGGLLKGVREIKKKNRFKVKKNNKKGEGGKVNE